MGQRDVAREASHSPVFATLLTAARGGDVQALGVLLQLFHPYYSGK
jgi:hypothetical protein